MLFIMYNVFLFYNGESAATFRDPPFFWMLSCIYPAHKGPCKFFTRGLCCSPSCSGFNGMPFPPPLLEILCVGSFFVPYLAMIPVSACCHCGDRIWRGNTCRHHDVTWQRVTSARCACALSRDTWDCSWCHSLFHTCLMWTISLAQPRLT